MKETPKQRNDRIKAEMAATRKAERAKEAAVREAAAAERNAANKEGTYARARHKARVLLPTLDGCVFVVSDQHYYPGDPPSTAHRASVALAHELRPFAIIANGDAIDGASISRWPVSSFTEMHGRPLVSAEIGEAASRLADYDGLDSVQYKVWNLGNHDARFETRLAEQVPQYAGVDGFTLKDHFPGWLPAWRTDFTETPTAVPQVIVKHRFKGGLYASHNNALWGGTSMVTGHDHMLWAKAISDVRGVRWGIGAGTLAPIDSKHFTAYTEDNIVNWQSGFAILHFEHGLFTGPELVYAMPDGRVLFRGKAVRV